MHERQFVSRRQTRDLTAVLLCPVARVTQEKLGPCISKEASQDTGSQTGVRLILRPIDVFFYAEQRFIARCCLYSSPVLRLHLCAFDKWPS
jgi:hypothetical protein